MNQQNKILVLTKKINQHETSEKEHPAKQETKYHIFGKHVQYAKCAVQK
jgi:hypothetical protein